MKVTADEKFEAELYSPLLLIMWLLQTFIIILTVYCDIMWAVFDDSSGINKWYTDRFNSLHAAFIWIAKDIGIIGCSMILILIVGYLWITKKLYIAFFYKLK